jgi:hypothetical protein
MKTLLLTLLTIAASSVSTFANLVDTFSDSVARYGTPSESNRYGTTWVLDQDHTIHETFDDRGFCDAIAYNNFEGFGDNELLTTIAQNIPPGDRFLEEKVAVGRFWGTTSGIVGALLYIRNNHGEGRNPQVLLIRTVYFLKRTGQTNFTRTTGLTAARLTDLLCLLPRLLSPNMPTT